MFTDREKRQVLEIARAAVLAEVTGTAPPSPVSIDLPEATGAFVTLRRRGTLRGCLGTLECRESLALEIARCAASAAREDPRFAPVAQNELPDLRIEVSVLGPLEAIDPVDPDAIVIGRHGLVVRARRPSRAAAAAGRARMGLDAERAPRPHLPQGRPRRPGLAARRSGLSLRSGGLRRLTDQSSQDLEVPAIERIDVAAPAALGRIELGGFEQHRQRGEPRVVDNPPEGLEPEPAFANVLVTIDAAAAGFLRVVHVKRLQSRKPDDPAEGVERLAIAIFRTDVVSRGQQVAGVEADADAWRAAERVDDGGEMFEPVAEVGSLAGRVLQQDHRPALGTRAQHLAEAIGNQSETVALRPCCERSRMHHQRVETERSARSSSSPKASIDLRRSRGSAAATLMR